MTQKELELYKRQGELLVKYRKLSGFPSTYSGAKALEFSQPYLRRLEKAIPNNSGGFTIITNRLLKDILNMYLIPQSEMDEFLKVIQDLRDLRKKNRGVK